MSPNSVTALLCGVVAVAAMVVANRVVEQTDTLAALDARARAGRSALAATCSTVANLLDARRWPEEDATLFDIAGDCIWRPDAFEATRVSRELARRERAAVVGRIRASVLRGRYDFDYRPGDGLEEVVR